MATLFEVAFSSFLYSELTDYENTYLAFRKRTGGTLNLAKQAHRVYLLEWLNKWGCRFETRKLPEVSEVVRQWYAQYSKELCSSNRHLWQLSGPEIDVLGDAYEDLRDRTAFRYRRDGKLVHRHVGATAASKIMFAMKPRAAIAWDDLMRKKMKTRRSSLTYGEYLEVAKNDLISLDSQCKEHGIKLTSLPAVLGRKEATPEQLVGESYWAKYTRGLEMPNPDVLKLWVIWSKTP